MQIDLITRPGKAGAATSGALPPRPSFCCFRNRGSGVETLRGNGAIGALMNMVLQPRPLIVLRLNVWMGTAAGADELVEIPTDARA